MPTPFSSENAEFSGIAHEHARTALYPRVFDVSAEALTFERTLLEHNKPGEILDGSMAIDAFVKVMGHPTWLRQPLVFTVQERFRKPEYARYEDLTITTWNHATNLPSELYKLAAQIFLYAYFDAEKATFVDAIAIDLTKTLMLLCAGKLPHTVRGNPRSRQDFICLRFADLENAGACLFRLGGKQARLL